MHLHCILCSHLSINVTIDAPYCPVVVGLGILRHSPDPMVPWSPGLETGQIKMGDVITDPRLIVVPDSTNNNMGELGLLRGGQTTQHTVMAESAAQLWAGHGS